MSTLEKWVVRLCVVGIAVVVLAYLTIVCKIVGSPAHAASASSQPYGGCKEAWQAPHSPGARDCRKAGYVVTSRVVIAPHQGRLLYNAYPACAYEDSPNCIWRAGRVGNHRGHSFVDVRGTAHYFGRVHH